MFPVNLFLIFLVALLYSAVGHGGATGYLAVMSLYGVPPAVMATTALILNCVTAGISLTFFSRAGFLSLRLTAPFVIMSIPAAFLGALVPVTKEQYTYLLGTTLVLAALRLVFYKNDADPDAERFVRQPNVWLAGGIGACLGFLSGAVGIGGGVFLSPVLILAGWADPKTTSATSAMFILANSVSGLVGRGLSGSLVCADVIPYLGCALVGAVLGSAYGSKISSGVGLRRLLAGVLLIAVVKMFMAL